MTDAERAALDWLDAWDSAERFHPEGSEYARILKAMIAQPRLINLANLSGDDCQVFLDAWYESPSGDSPFANVRAAFRALYQHLTRPRTKIVWRVHSGNKNGECWERCQSWDMDSADKAGDLARGKIIAGESDVTIRKVEVET